MLDKLTILICFLGSGIAFLIVLGIIRLTRSNKLPNGSVLIDRVGLKNAEQSPGNRWTQLGVAIPPIINAILEIIVIISCIFDFWDLINSIFAIDLPNWVNWTGIIGLFLCLGWSISVFFYNVNFTRLYKPLSGKYILATGGPYHYVRHPGYIEAAFEFLFFFLATGIWLIVFYAVIFLIALPFQAIAEENLMFNIFGSLYDEYAASTGQFLPGIGRKKRVIQNN